MAKIKKHKHSTKAFTSISLLASGSVHVWTFCKMQEKNNVNSKKANAVMYPAYS